MASIDCDAPLEFLRTAYCEEDWVAVFLKSYGTGQVAQRVRSVADVRAPQFQAWLRAANAAGAEVYVSVNSVAPHKGSRRRDAVHTIRHVFLDADNAVAEVLDMIKTRVCLPNPSYVLHSSLGRAHMFWRVTGFTCHGVEALQKHLARELGTDQAATACTQTTRIPGFVNHKHATPHRVTIEYRDTKRLFTATDFPMPPMPVVAPTLQQPFAAGANAMARARRYIAAVPPAIAGQHGDQHTFRVCCRLARGFALSDDQALTVLREWNVRCEPPWSERELKDKLIRARRYGREPIGGLLEERP